MHEQMDWILLPDIFWIPCGFYSISRSKFSLRSLHNLANPGLNHRDLCSLIQHWPRSASSVVLGTILLQCSHHSYDHQSTIHSSPANFFIRNFLHWWMIFQSSPHSCWYFSQSIAFSLFCRPRLLAPSWKLLPHDEADFVVVWLHPLFWCSIWSSISRSSAYMSSAFDNSSVVCFYPVILGWSVDLVLHVSSCSIW